MTIKTTSGGTVGIKDSGKTFKYEIEKETFLNLVGKVFDREVEDFSPEHETAGGPVAQFLHAYGVSATKMEKSGMNPFPANGEEFTEVNALRWFETLDFKTPRAKKVTIPLEERQAKWDANSAKMTPFMSAEEIIDAIGKRPAK